MSVHIKGRSTGPTTVDLVHESGARIATTAPKDNGGDGSSFSPTDLCAASLGACGATIMGIYAKNHGIDLEGVDFELEKEMSAAPRKIGRVHRPLHPQGRASARRNSGRSSAPPRPARPPHPGWGGRGDRGLSAGLIRRPNPRVSRPRFSPRPPHFAYFAFEFPRNVLQ